MNTNPLFLSCHAPDAGAPGGNCRRPVAYSHGGSHRCEVHTPDGCLTCFAWGRESCSLHAVTFAADAAKSMAGVITRTCAAFRAEQDRNAAAATARGYKPELKVYAGELPAWDHRIRCVSCLGGGANPDGSVCQLCRGEGWCTHGPHQQSASLYAGGDDPTAVDLPVVAS